MGLTPAVNADLGYWPLVRPWATTDLTKHDSFLALGPEAQRARLRSLQSDSVHHGALIHSTLSVLYADRLGYRDSWLSSSPDPAREAALLLTRGVLEHEMYEQWLGPVKVVRPSSPYEAARYLNQLRRRNSGVKHPLFDYLRTEATEAQMRVFLAGELIRNEVVDDEIALLLVGLQGKQRAVVAENLWDECGHGRVEDFHTTWLRRLAGGLGGDEFIFTYRDTMPWFAKISSNILMSMLVAPSRHQQAYGCFLVFESWVLSHFRDIMRGLRRLNLDCDDIMVYFTEHTRIDPRHSRDLLTAITEQSPRMTPEELARIVQGAEIAVRAAVRQYDHMLAYLISLDRVDGCGR